MGKALKRKRALHDQARGKSNVPLQSGRSIQDVGIPANEDVRRAAKARSRNDLLRLLTQASVAVVACMFSAFECFTTLTDSHQSAVSFKSVSHSTHPSPLQFEDDELLEG